MAERINIKNRRASFDYEILESFTAVSYTHLTLTTNREV